MRLTQSPRELSSSVSRIRCAELARLWLNPIMSIDLACLEVAQHRVQFIKLQLLDVQVTEKISRKGRKLLRRFDEPVQHRIGIDLKDPRSRTNAESLG